VKGAHNMQLKLTQHLSLGLLARPKRQNPLAAQLCAGGHAQRGRAQCQILTSGRSRN